MDLPNDNPGMAQIAKYLLKYQSLPDNLKSFYTLDEFISEISAAFGLQKTYEATGWPSEWPFSSIDKIPQLEQHIQWAKSEGATNEDIRWWWNLAPVDRIMIKGVDKAFRRMALSRFINEEVAPEDILEKTHQVYAMYSEEQRDLSNMTPADKQYYTGEDRPLPIEMHDRVDIHLKKLAETNDSSALEKNNFSSVMHGYDIL